MKACAFSKIINLHVEWHRIFTRPNPRWISAIPLYKFIELKSTEKRKNVLLFAFLIKNTHFFFFFFNVLSLWASNEMARDLWNWKCTIHVFYLAQFLYWTIQFLRFFSIWHFTYNWHLFNLKIFTINNGNSIQNWY